MAMGAQLSITRQAQLDADRARTSAILKYVRDHRERFESQLLDTLTKKEKRAEILRMARVCFKQEQLSVQHKYLRLAAGSGAQESEGANAEAVVQGAERVDSCVNKQPSAKRYRLRVKTFGGFIDPPTLDPPGAPESASQSQCVPENPAQQQEQQQPQQQPQ